MKVDPPGRPPKTAEPRAELARITFRIDAQTLEALEALERTSGYSDVRGRRSMVLRRVILDARAGQRRR
jgi:hypothetical protein